MVCFFTLARSHTKQMQGECSVDPSLSNGVAAQFAVLGIAPGPLGSLERFLACSPTRNPDGRLIADADLAVHEEVGLLLVRHEGLLVWSVEDGIALGVTRDMPVIVEKETDLSWMIGLIRHHNMTQENVIMEIHNIAEDQ